MDLLTVEPVPGLVPSLVDLEIASEVVMDPVAYMASASVPVRSPMVNPERR